MKASTSTSLFLISRIITVLSARTGKDTKSGKIIGSKSFGKGIIQSTLRLPDGDGIKLTIMEYFSPKGKSIHSKSVEPDIKVEAKPDDKTDEVLERAKTVLEGDMESGK